MPITKIRNIPGLEGVETENFLSFVWDKAVNGACIVDTNNVIVAVNATMAQWLGYPPAALEGKTWMEITKHSDVSDDLKGVQEVRDGKRDHYRMEKDYHTRDGGLLSAVLTVHAVSLVPGQQTLAFLSQIERADAPDVRPMDEYRVIVNLLAKHKKKVFLALIFLTLLGTEIRSAASVLWRDFEYLLFSKAVESREPIDPPE